MKRINEHTCCQSTDTRTNILFTFCHMILNNLIKYNTPVIVSWYNDISHNKSYIMRFNTQSLERAQCTTVCYLCNQSMVFLVSAGLQR